MSYGTLPEIVEAAGVLYEETKSDGDLYQTLVEYISRIRDIETFMVETFHPLMNNAASAQLKGTVSHAVQTMDVVRIELHSAHLEFGNVHRALAGYDLNSGE